MLALVVVLSLLAFSLIHIHPDTPGGIHRKRHLKKWTDLLLISAVFFLGIQISQPPSLAISPQGIYQLDVCCEERLPSDNYILEGQGIRLFLSRYHLTDTLRIGDSLRFQARILPIRETGNPGEFDYHRYLKQKNVYYKVVPCSPLELTGHGHNLTAMFESLRQSLLEKNARLFPDTATRNLTAALCLGYRNDLDKNMQNLFIETGTIHLLAVSGLHTGAIFLLLSFLFRCLRIPRHQANLLGIPLLWGYACLTGLSPSVVRASVILTFIAAGQTFERDYTPLNSVAASAFFTLLWHPHLIGSVSFLMSYAAYTGIVVIYPLLHRLSDGFAPLPDKVWALCSLNLSAQIPTLPIAAYYFHTVNASSLLVNLLAIPLATLILYASAALLVIPTTIGLFLAPAVDLSCKLLLYVLHLFQAVSLNIGGLYPTPVHVAFLYLCLILLLFFLVYRNRTTLYASIGSLCCFLAFACVCNLQLSDRKELVIFNYHQNSVILLNYCGHYSLLQNTFPDSLKIAPYLEKNKLKPLPAHSGLLIHATSMNEKSLHHPGQHIHICGTPPASMPPDIDILVVTHNLSPEEAFPTATPFPGMIVTDGSNIRANISKWERFCLENNILFENTTEKGCISILLK